MRKRSREPSAPAARESADAPASKLARADFVMERFGHIHEVDRSFDVEYWQRQGDAAIYAAAWELVELYHGSQRMGPDELSLQRSLETIQRA